MHFNVELNCNVQTEYLVFLVEKYLTTTSPPPSPFPPPPIIYFIVSENINALQQDDIYISISKIVYICSI